MSRSFNRTVGTFALLFAAAGALIGCSASEDTVEGSHAAVGEGTAEALVTKYYKTFDSDSSGTTDTKRFNVNIQKLLDECVYRTMPWSGGQGFDFGKEDVAEGLEKFRDIMNLENMSKVEFKTTKTSVEETGAVVVSAKFTVLHFDRQGEVIDIEETFHIVGDKIMSITTSYDFDNAVGKAVNGEWREDVGSPGLALGPVRKGAYDAPPVGEQEACIARTKKGR